MAAIFRMHALPAHHGDCIWLEYGAEAQRRHVLIDAGPSRGSDDRLARIEALGAASRRIELLVVTHVDADHIEGAIKLLHRQDAMGLTIGEVWFNGWPQLDRLVPADRYRRWDVIKSAVPKRGAAHGGYLGLQLAGSELPWNLSFRGAAAMVPDVGPLPTVTFADGLKLTLLSPDHEALDKLHLAWERAFRQKKIDEEALRDLGTKPRYRSAEEIERAIASEPPFEVATWALDESAANGSSIAFVAEFAGARVGLFADAHAPVLAASLRRYAAERGEKRVTLAAAKLAHHGSKANISRELLDAIDCENFVISTDGSVFHHPDPQVIAMLDKRRARSRVYFNHRNAHIEQRAALVGASHSAKRSSGFSAEYPQQAAEGTVLDLLALNPTRRS